MGTFRILPHGRLQEWVAEEKGYFRAEGLLYKHHFLKALPAVYHSMLDIRACGPGERMVFQLYTQEMFHHTHQWMASWELSPEEQYSNANYTGAVLV